VVNEYKAVMDSYWGKDAVPVDPFAHCTIWAICRCISKRLMRAARCR
jgi:hypothetical protein